MDPNLLTHSPIIGHCCSNTDNTIIAVTGGSKADKADTGRVIHELCIGSGLRHFLLFNSGAADRRPVGPWWGWGGAEGPGESGVFQRQIPGPGEVGSMLVACGFCYKLPQTQWLKNTNANLLSYCSGVQKLNWAKVKVELHSFPGGFKGKYILASLASMGCAFPHLWLPFIFKQCCLVQSPT